MIINSVSYATNTSQLEKSISVTALDNTDIIRTNSLPINLKYTISDTAFDSVISIIYKEDILEAWDKINMNDGENINLSIEPKTELGLYNYKIVAINGNEEVDKVKYRLLYYPDLENLGLDLNTDGFYTLSSYTGVGNIIEIFSHGYTSDGGIKKINIIGNGLFQDNDNVQTITLPSTINVIRSNAFTNARNLSSLIIHAVIPPSVSKYTFNTFYNTESTLTIRVPASSLESYQSALYWKDLKITWGTIDDL